LLDKLAKQFGLDPNSQVMQSLTDIVGKAFEGLNELAKESGIKK
jgi:hypothetical protein